MTRTLPYRDLGTRTLNGTDWPVRLTIRRDGPRQWTLTATCNGIADWGLTYRSRSEAVAALLGYPNHDLPDGSRAPQEVTRG